jgi:hypothetical protein
MRVRSPTPKIGVITGSLVKYPIGVFRFTIVRAIGGALAKHSPTREGDWVQILDNGSYTHGDLDA